MPGWLINIIVTIAVKVGLPWVIKKFPGIPQEILAVIVQLIEDLNNPGKSNSISKKVALNRVSKLCTVGCENKLK